MGRGSSKVSGGGGGSARANTPSGVSMEQFNQMSMDQKINTINAIVADRSIVVPIEMDDSETSKVIYALGMTNKPTVVDDATLDSMQGRELFRTVYESGSMPPPTSKAIADQIRYDDYTQMSGSGGSAHGRAIYFATEFTDSTIYGDGYKRSLVMRAKINPNANIVSERRFFSGSEWTNFQNKYNGRRWSSNKDAQALYALSKGVDGWYSNTYNMIINRGILTMSSQNKHISTDGKSSLTSRNAAQSWSAAKPMK